MNLIITCDWHLTDNAIENYRWDIFKILKQVGNGYKEIYILGDLTERKDRHSGVLINRLVEEFSLLQIAIGVDIFIISGNHDQPQTGPYYWTFLNKLGIPYITKPVIHREIIYLLPFSENPKEEWKDLDLNSVQAIFMHQTGQGVKVEGDFELTSNNLPKFPDGVFVASGDIHRPQEADGITYVGTPHPVRFSENWRNRIVLIDNDDFTKPISLWLPSIKRAILEIESTKDLENVPYGKGDQLRVRYKLSSDQFTTWPEEQRVIKEWAKSKGIHIASLEAALVGEGVKVETNSEALAMELAPPAEIVQLFCKQEGLSQEVTEVGLQLLKEAKQ